MKGCAIAFAFGSCFRPAGAQGGPIFDKIAERRQKHNLRFMLRIPIEQLLPDLSQLPVSKPTSSFCARLAIAAPSG